MHAQRMKKITVENHKNKITVASTNATVAVPAVAFKGGNASKG